MTWCAFALLEKQTITTTCAENVKEYFLYHPWKKTYAETTQGKSNHLVILAHLIWQKPRWSSRFLFFCDNKEWNTILTLLDKQADWRRVYFSGDIFFYLKFFSSVVLATAVL